MKILHVYKDYYPVLGGIENHVRALAEAQVARGHHVGVLVNALDRHTSVEERNGVRVMKAARVLTVGGSVPLSLSFPVLLARLPADVAHLHFPYPLGEVANLLIGRSRRTIITYHSDVVRQQRMLRIYQPLLWSVLRRADRIIATSPNYIRSSPYLSQLQDRCTVVPLGVDEPRFAQADPAAVAAWQARVAPGGEPVLLFVGRLRYYKGLDTLIQALPQLADVPLKVMIVGDGPMLRDWQALAAKCGVAGRIAWETNVPDEELPAVYHAAAAYVLPANSRAEAFGVALLEAMSAGLPVVTTEVETGTSWVVQDGVTGSVVSPRDSEALAAALRALLLDPERRAALGAAGHARVLAEFTESGMIDRVMALYDEVLAVEKKGEKRPATHGTA